MADLSTLASDAILGNPVDPKKTPSTAGVVAAFTEAQTQLNTLSESLASVQEVADAASETAQEALDAANAGVKPDKQAVRVLATANVTIASALENGDTLDGVTLATGDRVALTGQTAPAENGVYVVAASGAASRATDLDTSDELLRARFSVTAGTHAGEAWSVQNTAAITVGTDAITIAMTTPSNPNSAEIIAARGTYSSVGSRFDGGDSRAGVASIFPDPFFEATRNYLNVLDQANPTHKLTHSSFKNGTFDPAFRHWLGRGAWIFDATNSTAMAFNCWFADQGFVPGDVISVGVAVHRTSGTMRTSYRWYESVSDASNPSSVVNATDRSSGTDYVDKFENLTIPSSKAGITIFLNDVEPSDGVAALVAIWIVPGALAGDRPPARVNPLLLDYRRRKPRETASSSPAARGVLPVDYPLMTRRWYMMAGRPSRLWKDNLLRTRAPREILIGGVTAGAANEKADRYENLTPAAGDSSFSINVFDSDSMDPIWRVTYDYSQSTAHGIAAPSSPLGSRDVLCIGPSTTLAATSLGAGTPADNGEYTAIWINQMLYHASQNANAVQYTFLGTLGVAPALHEGRGGWKVDDYYQPEAGRESALAPVAGQKFHFGDYLTDNSIAQPDIVVWDIGLFLNDFSTYESMTNASVTEATLLTAIADKISKLKEMIGVTSYAGSIWAVDPAIKIVLCTTMPGNNSQDGWTGMTFKAALHRRWQRMAVFELLKEFDTAAMEALGLFVMPWHLTVCPNAYDASSSPLGSFSSDQNIHPTWGYKQMGTDLDTMINIAVTKGWL